MPDVPAAAAWAYALLGVSGMGILGCALAVLIEARFVPTLDRPSVASGMALVMLTIALLAVIAFAVLGWLSAHP
jgi:hypothetical protein